MAASPELRRPPSPVDFKLGPFLALSHAEDGGGECRTPNTKESKIPPIASCPPAPKKTRRMEVSCKRRLSELELFRVGPELMGLLFRPLDPRGLGCLTAPSSAAKKRKGCCLN